MPAAAVVWINHGVAGVDGQAFVEGLAGMTQNRAVTVLKAERAPALALAGAENATAHLAARLVRAEPNGRDSGTVRALDLKNLPLADAPFAFPAGATDAEVRFELPIEIRNSIARIEILGEGSAGAVALLDERGKRRRVGLVFGGTTDQAQPLLAPNYYLSRALSPYAEVREGRGAVADSVSQLLNEQVSVLIFADVGALDRETLGKVAGFVERGGVLLRFAGSRLAAGNDDLVPVRLRRGGRNLGGTLAWDTPRTFSPFTRESPFFGLPIPADLGVRRQILAEPEGDLTEKTWAALQDGTPIVTAGKRGEGLLVLFHVTADTTWSNLPLSGLFVDMLRRVVGLAGAADDLGAEARNASAQTVAPRLVLDGYGSYVSPPPTARPVSRHHAERATRRASAGLLRPGRFEPCRQRARDRRQARAARPQAPQRADRAARRREDHRPARAAVHGGAARAPRRHARLAVAERASRQSLRPHAAGGLGGGDPPRRARLLVAADARAQERAPAPPPLSQDSLQSALVTRLAYVVTGDAQTDATSKAGLVGLTQVLAEPHRARAGRADRRRSRPATSSPSTRCSTGRSRRAGRCRTRPRSAASTPS